MAGEPENSRAYTGGSTRDWAEDFSHENGNYFNLCCTCGLPFLGHKRRVVCKTCTRVFPSEDIAREAEKAEAVTESVQTQAQETPRTKQVFSPSEVASLWKHQFGPFEPFQRKHPFTCANRHDHPLVAGDNGVLVPTVRGWICPFCDYTQNWAHPEMKCL